MENVINAQVLGIRRGEVDGNKYASIYVLESSDPADNNTKGMIPMKLTCEHALMDNVDDKTLPGEFEIAVKLTPASGGKLGMKATAMKPLKQSQPQPAK